MATAGFSSGEFAALVFAGSMSFEDGSYFLTTFVTLLVER